jgi:hypothetical protein
LIGDTYACTEVASYKTDKARATSKLKHVQTLKGGSTPGDVARQYLQTTHVVARKNGIDDDDDDEKGQGKMDWQ